MLTSNFEGVLQLCLIS